METTTSASETSPLISKPNQHCQRKCVILSAIISVILIVAVYALYQNRVQTNTEQVISPMNRLEVEDSDHDILSSDWSTSNCAHSNDQYADGISYSLVN